MANSDFHPQEEEFIEARNYWELEKLYIDLASSKGKALTPVEKKFLRGLLCGFSPAEIATTVYKSRSSSTVRVYLSNGLYKYLEEMLSNQTQTNVKIKIWSRVTQLLEKAGYKKNSLIEADNHLINKNQPDNNCTPVKNSQQNWGEAVDVSIFYGRKAEIIQLQQAIIEDKSQLIFILGIAGIGKTALSIKLAQQVQDNFEFVFWRSLHLTPSLDIILNQLIEFLSPLSELKATDTVEEKINHVLEYLRTYKCLIVFDAFDSILTSESPDQTVVHLEQAPRIRQIDINQESKLHQIHYRPGYEKYGDLIRRLGESQHQSCILITSREKPQEVNALGGNIQRVQNFSLTGLSDSESAEVLKAKGLTNLKLDECEFLNSIYNGNPLFLKIVASTIKDLFFCDIGSFIEQQTMIFGEIRTILDSQFHSLNLIEQQILYYLAFNSDLLSLAQINKNIAPRISQRLILEAMELLQRKSLIEHQDYKFTIAPVFVQYLTERLIEENLIFSHQQKASFLINHSLFENYLKKHFRASSQ
ncbi:NB-ARC domain-containing protein [Calothrix sp. PCC 6303]|uniref:NB-ARC domain-containing protein n=1 Tax=Calothrix sp. PCC 6303 TaxID=1170562 RepID=UPI0002A026A6|nr:NB-ARC domain-containing protein [Calothrix sp. PCC 6303]AFZ00146.1 WD40 repeat-containing protein [Calothrix sp. PCC 6303]